MCGTFRCVASNFSVSMSKIETDQVIVFSPTDPFLLSRKFHSYSSHGTEAQHSFPVLATLFKKEPYWCHLQKSWKVWPSASLLKISADLSQDSPVRFDSCEWGIMSIKTTTRSKNHRPWSYPSKVWSFWSFLCLLSLLMLLCRSS